jgi:hypothetical protein
MSKPRLSIDTTLKLLLTMPHSPNAPLLFYITAPLPHCSIAPFPHSLTQCPIFTIPFHYSSQNWLSQYLTVSLSHYPPLPCLIVPLFHNPIAHYPPFSLSHFPLFPCLIVHHLTIFFLLYTFIPFLI